MRYVVLGFTVVCQHRCKLPLFKGSTLRGAFGQAFHDIVCINSRQNCEVCKFAESCLFFKFFYAETNDYKRNHNVPRPYIFRSSNFNKTFEPGDNLYFEIILFGNAIELTRLVCEAIDLAIYRGLGIQRARFALKSIFASGKQERKKLDINKKKLNLPELYEITTPENSREKFLKGSLIEAYSPINVKKFNIKNARVMPGVFFKAYLRRVSTLCRYWSEDEWKGFAFKNYFEELDKIELIGSNLRYCVTKRYSRTNDGEFPVSGYIGNFVVGKIPLSLANLLVHCENIHVGKGATWGMGMVKAEGFLC
jgi:hypothetical protein